MTVLCDEEIVYNLSAISYKSRPPVCSLYRLQAARRRAARGATDRLMFAVQPRCSSLQTHTPFSNFSTS